MRIHTKVVYQMLPTGGLQLISDESYAYEGPVDKLDRAASSNAKKALGESQDVASSERGSANQISSSLIPGLEREANDPMGYTPEEQNDMLVASMQGLGGAASGIEGQANLEAARTGNTGAYGTALDDAMREKGRILSQNALGVKNESARLGEEKQMKAQSELGNIYGMDQGAMLKSMGLENDDINTEIQAGKSGWLQNMNDTITAVSGAANSAANAKKAFG